MSAASDHTENLALNYLLTAGSVTRPTNWYVALFTSDAGLEAGTISSEVSGVDYVRKTVAFTVTTNSATNNGAVTFDPAGSGGWGTVTHVAVMDASTGGNVLFHGAVTTSKTLDENDTFQISDSNLTISLN
jgi:hypothetical protein